MYIWAVENALGFKKFLQVKGKRPFQAVTLQVQQQLIILLVTYMEWIGLCLLFCENPGLPVQSFQSDTSEGGFNFVPSINSGYGQTLKYPLSCF